MLGPLRRRLRYLLNRDERARLLREEMEFHVDMRTEELMADGLTESEARGLARRQFGNLTQQQEASRATWVTRWLSDLAQDLVYAGRTFRNQPGFAAVAALSAALGIGACSMIFGVANHALFHRLPVHEPSQLVSISSKSLARGKVGMSLPYPDYEDMRGAQSFQGMTAFFSFLPVIISSNGEPQRYWGSLVTSNYFDVVRPVLALGRGFASASEKGTPETGVVVISHRLWRSRFASDPNIIGKNIDLNGRRATVIGVTGPGFRGTETMFFSDLWVPFSMIAEFKEAGMTTARLEDRSSQWLSVIGRVADGVSPTAAASEIEVVGHRLRTAYPATNKDRSFHVERAGQLHPAFRRTIVVFFLMLVGVAALVLLTACANVANLLLARASARQKEIATRLALGGGRGRLVRQLLTESVLLALIGGAGGYLIAQLGAGAIGRIQIPMSMPVDLAVPLDYRVVLFSTALSTITGVFFGLVPALRATRVDLVPALKQEAISIGRSRRFGLRNILVVAQVTICMVLLICSGLFLRSLRSASTIDVGIEHRNLLMLGFDPSINRSAAETRRVLDVVLENARHMTGVESATVSSGVPLNIEGTQNGVSPLGDRPQENSNQIAADVYSVTPDFFKTFGIPLLDGEDFRPGLPADDIVIINKALADSAFPDQNPIGRRLQYLGRVVRVVGLVATAKSRTIGEDPHPCLYSPMARDLRGNDSLTGMTLTLRTTGDPAVHVPAAHRAMRNVDPALAVFDVRTMETQLSRALFFPRLAAILFGLAGFMGLLIATVGIYGLISFTVARQTRDIGIRMALGARKIQVLAMVLKQGIMLTAVGSAIGLAVAFAASRITASVLYGVSPTDTLTFVLVPLLLLSVALLACFVPARYAASLNPTQALRCE